MIRPGLPVFRRDAAQLQFGTAIDDCFVVEDRPGLVALLRLLNGARDTATVAFLARERIPALVDEPESLIAALAREGIVVDSAGSDALETHDLRAEARSLLAQRLSPDEISDRLARRARSCVELRADARTEPIASAVADGLRTTGIDTTRVADTLAAVTVVVTAGTGDRTTFARLGHDHMPHLPVVAIGPRVVVGPFVDVGLTPCAMCLDLWRQESDPSWAAVTAQLDAPLAPAQDTNGEAVSTATRLAAAALVVEEITAFCDDTVPHTTSKTITIGPGGYDRTESATAFHPRCQCRAARGAVTELA